MINKNLFKFFLIVLILITPSFGHAKNMPLSTVEYVDINKYMGKWYEIAAFPQWYEKNCTGTTAEYTLLTNGKVSVVNSCFLHTLDGKLKVAKGTAYVEDKTTNAKLKVTFFWPFYGDYWILVLDQNYQYVLVGTPDRKSLWFLSRTPYMTTQDFDYLKSEAVKRGFDVSKLQLIVQRKAD